MRKIYLVRHGIPEFPGGEKMCIGSTDIPVSTLGRMQGFLAGVVLKKPGFHHVYSSPLSRAVGTAEMISPSFVTVEGLRESYAGDWEGLTFKQIRKLWPELYARRGIDQNIPIPNAESPEESNIRFSRAVEAILRETQGDIVIVSHVSVIRGFICGGLGIPLSQSRNIEIPYGSYTTIEYAQAPHVTQVGKIPQVPLDEDICLSIMEAAGAEDRIIAHCRKVAEKAGEIADALILSGCPLNKPLIVHSALLHDIARCEHDHAVTGGALLRTLGYGEEGEIVSLHHSILPVEIGEAAVLSVADRMICDTEEVGIVRRFALSREKCLDEKGRTIHSERYENTVALRDLINSLCKRNIAQ